MILRQLIAIGFTALLLHADSIGANGVITFTDPKVNVVLGQMIAYGYNPWGYADEREREMVDLQVSGPNANNYNTSNAGAGQWKVPNHNGTIAYDMLGVGPGFGQTPDTTLTADITPTATSIAIADASKIPGLLSLPTWILIGPPGSTHSQEMIRITATTATTGAATLTVGYDGRGLSDANGINASNTLASASAWHTGDGVGEYRVYGTSTKFGTDADRPVCPAGLPGPPGAVVYSTGTVRLAASSTTVTGTSTLWNNTNNVYSSYNIRVAAFHGGGTPFIWWARATAIETTLAAAINSSATSLTVLSSGGFPATPFLALIDSEQMTVTNVAGTTWTVTRAVNGSTAASHAYQSQVADPLHLTASRPAPSDVDTTTDFSYKITSTRYVSLEFADPGSYPHTGGTYRALANIKGCESETAMFGVESYSFDPFLGVGSSPFLGSRNQTGVHYSYKDALGAQSAFGANFYGTGLAAYIHYRSTLSAYSSAETLSDGIDNYYIGDPEMGGCFGPQASPLLIGGGIIGGFVKLILDSTTTLDWSQFRGCAEMGYSGNGTRYGAQFGGVTASCNGADTRDSGYPHTWLALAALYDPDSSWKAHWIAGLQAMAVRDAICQHPSSVGYSGSLAYSFANAANWNNTNPALSFANSSTDTATGTGFNAAGMCLGQFAGMVTFTNGSYTATLSSTAAGGLSNTDLRLWATDNAGYTAASEYLFSGSTITLANRWDGANGTFSALSERQPSDIIGLMSSIGNGGAYPTDDNLAGNLQLTKSYACRTLDDTHIQFDRVPALSGSGYHLYRYTISGFMQQPFMYGIKAKAVKWSCAVNDVTVRAFYCPLLPRMGTWAYTYGRDPNTLGTYYAIGGSQNLCYPGGTPNPTTLFNTIRGAYYTYDVMGNKIGEGDFPCGQSGLLPTTGGEYLSRVASAELMAAYIEYYLDSPNVVMRAQIDEMYGAIYGKCSMSVSVYCDAHYVNENNELYDGSIGAYKWPGFFFGMGMARQWPAIRVLDLSPKTPAIGSLIRVGSGIRF